MLLTKGGVVSIYGALSLNIMTYPYLHFTIRHKNQKYCAKCQFFYQISFHFYVLIHKKTSYCNVTLACFFFAGDM